ncbi:cysteine desulfurase family protein [Sphingomonas aracearum]|uniref:Cysteine desulfurase n=1 Tax=Sphingomonas aracearum TaxID=2283317 RepID=A0A369VXV0_9SPHN|nr:cysteine desulfurase family protein [Sphingomonas aracearum]RDE06437.1 cysteine desulfurase [Sphingomonas aracearum]
MIYLDYQASTPLAPEAFDAMVPWLRDQHANPHSAHRPGRAAKAAVEVARDEIVAALFGGEAGVPPGRLVFTSGATEALNWAISGTYERMAPRRRRVVTIAIEHAAVLDSVRALERHGAEVVVLPVDRTGLLDAASVAHAVNGETALVVGMYVNNEVGTIQHAGLAQLAERARAVGAPMICDAAQAFGKMTLPAALFDMVALSAHKMHGPKGIGGLWVREGQEPMALLQGGGQEAGLRSGTLSPALCAGFGAAARLARQRMGADQAHVQGLFERAWALFEAAGWQMNGHRLERYQGNLNVRRDGLDVNRLMSDCRDLAFSAGSACASGSGRPSHVLRALGLSDAEARSSVRLGWGRYTSEAELTAAVERILGAADMQR